MKELTCSRHYKQLLMCQMLSNGKTKTMNARTQLRNISGHELEQCLKCTICTAYCPVAAVEPAYAGPKQAGPDAERYRLKGDDFFEQNLKLCLNCKRCEVACPNGVKIADIIQAARIKHNTHAPSLRDRMLASTDFVGTLAHNFAPITNFALGLKPTKIVLDSIMKIDKHRTFPAYSFKTFESWFKHQAESQSLYPKHVSYFHGCYANYNYPKLGKDFVKIMNACGYGVRMLEKEKCCGVAMIANGMYNEVKKNGLINIRSMEKAIKEGDSILTTSSTCTFTMRDEYKELLGIDNSQVRDRLMLATRFIYREIEAGKIKLAFRKDFHRRLAYHSACHMEKMGWVHYSTELLRMIPGVELIMLESQCCGIAGTYGFKKENYKRSQEIGAGLFKNIQNCDPDAVITDCETCKWQIEMSTGYSVENPITTLADALDVDETRKINNVQTPFGNP